MQSNISKQIFPYKLTFALTYNCNSRCKTCSIWKKESFLEITVSEIHKFVKKYPYFEWVALTGGEVFLREDISEIFDIFNYHSKNPFFFSIATNGLQPDRIYSTIRKVLAKDVNKLVVTVSLDGNSKTHDSIRGIPDNFGKAIKTYKLLKKLENSKFSVYFGHTVSSLNQNTFNSMISNLKTEIPDIVPENIHVNFAGVSNHFYDNYESLNLLDKIPRDIADFIKERRIKLNPINYIEKRFLSLAPKYFKSLKSPIPCQSLRTSIFIDAYGDVYPCSMMSTKLGGLRESNYDLNAILSQNNSKKVLSEIQCGNCPGCWTPCEAYQSILSRFRF